MKLRFLGATIKSLTWYPREEDKSKFVLLLRAPLTTKLADSLQCRGLCFSEPDGNQKLPAKQQAHPTPRKWEGSIGVPVEIAGGDIALGDRSFPFELAHKFSVGRDEKASDTDITLYVTARIHIDGKELLLYKFCQETIKKTFGYTITPAQGAFKFMDQEEEEPEPEPDDEK